MEMGTQGGDQEAKVELTRQGEEKLAADEAPAGSLPRQLGWEACGFPQKLELGLRRPRPPPTSPGKTSDLRGALSRV